MATLVSNVGNLVSEMLNPVGTVIQGPITSAPTGYLLCNGQAVERTKYSKLFDVIGTNFGSGDDSTTFNVPDYRGCFLRMLSTDTTQNTNMYAKQGQGLPNITGTSRFAATASNFSDGTGAFSTATTGLAITGTTTGTYWKPYFDASKSNSIYGASTEVRPVNYAINYFIKY